MIIVLWSQVTTGLVTSVQIHYGNKASRDGPKMCDDISELKEVITNMVSKDGFSKQTIKLAHRRTALRGHVGCYIASHT